jgi:hypothetical protein
MTEPILSVVVVVGDCLDRLPGCLQSLAEQDIADQMEIVVIDAGRDRAQPTALNGLANARIAAHSPDVCFGQLRAEGVMLCRAPIVAFLEEHCRAMPGWARAITKAFEGPWAAVGGEVHNGNPGIGVSNAVWLMNYERWLPPTFWRETRILPGHNTAYRRDVLLEQGDLLGGLLQSEPLLQWQLAQQGRRLLLDPAVKFAHINETQVSQIVKGYFWWNRHFGMMRAALYRWSTLTKALRVLVAPAVPWVRLLRLLGAIIRRSPHLLPIAARMTPAILVAHSAAVLGLTWGALFGSGGTEASFLDYELNGPRRMA